MKKLCAGTMLMSASLVWGATCETSGSDLGTFWPNQPTTFGARCVADAPTDPGALSFSHTFNFHLAGAASSIYGSLSLYPTGGSLNNPLYELINPTVYLLRNGVWTTIGAEGAGFYDHVNVYAGNLEAGDYTMRISGNLFDFGARAGRYTGRLFANYLDPNIAAPVPEPETLALLLLGVPVAVATARRRRKEVASK